MLDKPFSVYSPPPAPRAPGSPSVSNLVADIVVTRLLGDARPDLLVEEALSARAPLCFGAQREPLLEMARAQ